MKLKLNKKKVKNLSLDNAQVALEATPQIAGGVPVFAKTEVCHTNPCITITTLPPSYRNDCLS
ncbi:hypothetical protein AAEU28_18365 [Pseudoalteromonas sp. SS15]|uniref:Class I lanthipeptide n=1 Tax=Pseudoalteromonas phenolica TaxID=161398 RepID=A0A5R9Q7E6_9GAMM|nr:hypothetical protein [Pseudoalteromonas phenolica]TLX48724.1 hypothetical protein C1E24_02320 [Pseudoalteromonas phenolica]